ncbi:uncharacterized protein [Pithys albifrons albifrons]|uniref:uncharacterized protein n=1 Tax=Pithys albifrons albifrons TaxID=3385563 RepID=UPI003A5CB724
MRNCKWGGAEARARQCPVCACAGSVAARPGTARGPLGHGHGRWRAADRGAGTLSKTTGSGARRTIAPRCFPPWGRAVGAQRRRGGGGGSRAAGGPRRGGLSPVATAHAQSPSRHLCCPRATSRRRTWRCFPAPAAAGAAGARGEHPAAGAAAPEAFLERGAGTIARSAAAKIPGVLGGFLKLIASKASDPQGFDLLNSIMEHMPPESVDWYRKQIFNLLFQRFPNSKPTKLIKRFLCCRPSLLGLFELPEDDTTPDKEHFIDTEDTPGYQTAFSQLAFAGKKEHDPVGQMVNNPRIQLAQSLHKLFTACPGRVGGLGSASLGCIQQRRNASVRMVSC